MFKGMPVGAEGGPVVEQSNLGCTRGCASVDMS